MNNQREITDGFTCDSVSAPSAFAALGSTSACEGGAVTQWRISAVSCCECAAPLRSALSETARGGEGGEDTAHGRTLRSIMAPIGLKAVVGESKTIMLILGYWGLIFNHMCVLFYGTFPLHVSLEFLSVRFSLDAAGCFPAIVLNGEDITLGMLRMRIVHHDMNRFYSHCMFFKLLICGTRTRLPPKTLDAQV